MIGRKRILALSLLLLLLAAVVPASAQLAKSPPLWCMAGGQAAITQGLASTSPVQVSLPACTITVNVHSGSLATIYSDAFSTPLANPFTANSDATYAFYASVSNHYDIITQGTIACIPLVNGCSVGGTMTITTTLSDVLVGAVATSGGTITGVSPTPNQGLAGGGTTGSVSLGLQSCASGQVLSSSGAAWSCSTLPTGTITSVNPGGGLTGGGSSGAVTVGFPVCAANQTLVSNGSSNSCSSLGVGTITGITTSTPSGLTGGGTSGTLALSLGSCPIGQVWQSSGGGAWTCAANGTGTVTSVGATSNGGLVAAGTGTAPTLGLLTSCSANQILQWTGSAWACASVSVTPGGTSGSIQYNKDGVLGGAGSYNSGTNTWTFHNVIADAISITSPYVIQSTFPASNPICPAGFVVGQTCMAISSTGQLVLAVNGSPTFQTVPLESATAFSPSSGSVCTDSNGALTTTGCSSASGSIVAAPGAAQTIVQPLSGTVTTTLAVNSFNNIRYVTPAWNWSNTDSGGSLGNLTTAGAGLTITLPTCPAGIDTSSAAHNYVYRVYISGTGTAEAALVTGGTCTPGLASGTLIVTTANNHPNGYTVGSASTGIQEAWNDAWVNDAGTAPNASSQAAPYLKLESNTPYNVYSSVYLRGRGGILDGAGAIIACSTRDRCIYVGITSGSPGVNHHKLYNLTMVDTLLVDGANVSSVSASSGTYTITTAATHPFVAGDVVDCEYHSQTSDQHWMSTVLSAGLTGTQFEVTFGALSFSAGATTFGFCNIENAAIEDNSDNVVIQDIHLIVSNPLGTGAFNYGIINDNDQHLDIARGANRSASSINPGPGHRTSLWPIGAFVYERNDNGNDGITYLHDSEFTNINCVTGGGNGLVVTNTICQANVLFGFRYFGGLQPATFENNYEENGLTNPLYSGSLIASMGYLSQGGFGTKFLGTWPIAGVTPTFTGTGSTCTQRNYYVVPHSSAISTGIGPVIYIGTSGTATCATTVNLQWPSIRLQDTSAVSIGTLTWDVLATTGTTTPPPNGNGNYLVSGGSGISGSCTTTGMCSFTDNQSALSSYTVAGQTFHPTFWFWPAALVMNSATPMVFDSLPEPISIVSQQGTLGVSAIAQQCYSGGTIPQYARSPVWLSCINGPTSGGAGSQATVLQQADQSNNGPFANSKGRYNFGKPVTLLPNDLLTLQDSNLAKTLATAGERPSNDANDMALGVDNTGGGFYARAPLSVETYIGRLADGVNFTEQQLPGSTTYNNPVTVAGLNDACVDTGTINALACTMGSALTSLTTGQLYFIVPKFPNSGAATISINGIASIPLTKGGTNALPLQGLELTAGFGFWGYYDGVEMQVQPPVEIDLSTFPWTGGSADMAQGIRNVIAAQPAGTSIIINAERVNGNQTWTTSPWADLLGTGYSPTKTIWLKLCNVSISVWMSNVVTSGSRVTGCGNNLASGQGVRIKANTGHFVTTKTLLATNTIASGIPLESTFTRVSGSTLNANQIGMFATVCINTVDLACVAGTSGNAAWGHILSISAPTFIVLTPGASSGLANGSNVTVILNGCVLCQGDNSSQGAGSSNFDIFINGVTLDANTVAGAIPFANTNCSNLCEASDLILAPSDNIGAYLAGPQAQNSTIHDLWINGNTCLATQDPIGFVNRMVGSSILLGVKNISIALSNCNSAGMPASGGGATYGVTIGAQGNYDNFHVLLGTASIPAGTNDTYSIGFQAGENIRCPVVCGVAEGSIAGSRFTNINTSQYGLTAFKQGAGASVVTENITSDNSTANFTNLAIFDAISCTLTQSSEATLGSMKIFADGTHYETTSGQCPFSISAPNKIGALAFQANGAAPTCAFTSGGGTLPGCALDTGSSNQAGVIIATTGTGSPAGTGTITLTFNSSPFGTNKPACQYQASDNGAGQWNALIVMKDKTPSTSSDLFTWTNGTTPSALNTSSAYWINYQCWPK